MRFRLFLAGIFLFSTFVCSVSNAQQSNANFSPCTLHVENHYGNELFIKLPESTEKVFVDLYQYPQPISFLKDITLDTRLDFTIADRGYMRVERNDKESAFFSVDKECHISSYVGHGVAYTWEHKDENPTVVFCTSEHYKQQGSCE